MNTPSVSNATMRSSIPRGPPGVVTFRYKHEMGSELAYVPLAATHEVCLCFFFLRTRSNHVNNLQEAQEIAARAFPTLLSSVDPSWLFFTIAIRYKSTGERKEIGISPNAWFYVTSKLVAYRLIDVHVVPPSSPRSSATQSFAPLYTHSPSKQDVPPYPESESSQCHAPPYPDSPPPKYPGSPKKQLRPYLPPSDSGYGYGFGWRDQTQDHESYSYPEPQATHSYDPFLPDPQEGADRRSAGWSSTAPKRANHGWGGMGLFSSIRQRLFPITWNEPERRPRRHRHEHHYSRVKPSGYDQEHDHGYPNASRSGRSYVPSLI